MGRCWARRGARAPLAGLGAHFTHVIVALARFKKGGRWVHNNITAEWWGFLTGEDRNWQFWFVRANQWVIYSLKKKKNIWFDLIYLFIYYLEATCAVLPRFQQSEWTPSWRQSVHTHARVPYAKMQSMITEHFIRTQKWKDHASQHC